MKLFLAMFMCLCFHSANADDIRALEEAKTSYLEMVENCGGTDISSYEGFDIYIIESKKLNVECIQSQMSSHPFARSPLVGDIVDKRVINNNFDDSSATRIDILSLFSEQGGEVGSPSEENIIIQNDTYYYILGDRLRVETKILKENIFHITIDGSHYDLNYLFDSEKKILVGLGDGNIVFEEDGIVKYWVKSYLADGAFWYNVKIDYQGNYVELLNMEEHAGCYPYEEFVGLSEEFRKTFKRQKLDKLCVWHK